MTSDATPPIDDDEDARLMLAVQAEDPLAFEQLMQRNQARVAAFLRRFVGEQAVEDLTQEVFMRVYRHRATYRHEARFTTWLYRVAHNVAFNALRSKNRRPEALFSSVQKHFVSGTTALGFEESVLGKTDATPTKQIAKVELQQIVRDAVENLPPRPREATILPGFNSMRSSDIASVINMTTQAVKSLLCRARLNLKEILAPYVDDGRRES